MSLQADLGSLPEIENSLAVFCMATYGEGDPTDNAQDFYDWLQETDVDLSGVKYAVSHPYLSSSGLPVADCGTSPDLWTPMSKRSHLFLIVEGRPRGQDRVGEAGRKLVTGSLREGCSWGSGTPLPPWTPAPRALLHVPALLCSRGHLLLEIKDKRGVVG